MSFIHQYYTVIVIIISNEGLAGVTVLKFKYLNICFSVTQLISIPHTLPDGAPVWVRLRTPCAVY